jgi:tetratricopeptide (TPR) repeat protein
MLFFPRLRRQAKWVFLALAIVFAGGFIFFGVGSGSQGLGDIFQGNTNTTTYLLVILGVLVLGAGVLVGWLASQPGNRNLKIAAAIVLAAGGIALLAGAATHSHGGSSAITKLQKQVQKHPDDAEGWRSLGRALQTAGRTDEAVTAFETYTGLRPNDSGGWQELASLYLTQAQNYYNQIIEVQYRLSNVPGAGLGLPGDSFLAKEQQKNPIYTSLVDELNKQLGDLETKLSGTLSQRAGAWKRAANTLAADDPNLPSVVFQWARASEDAQDYKTAIAAYKRYLKLVPEGSLATDAKTAIKRLEKLLKGQSGTTG